MIHFVKDHGNLLGWGLLVVFVSSLLFLVLYTPATDSREQEIRDHYHSLSASEQFDFCFYFGTTSTEAIVSDALQSGWDREDVTETLIPVTHDLCGFTF